MTLLRKFIRRNTHAHVANVDMDIQIPELNLDNGCSIKYGKEPSYASNLQDWLLHIKYICIVIISSLDKIACSGLCWLRSCTY